MKDLTLDAIAGMEDDELRALLGQDKSLESFKEEVSKMQALPEKAKKEAETRLQDRLTPRLDGESLRWIREDAVRATSKKQSGKEAYEDCEVSSVI